MGDVTTLSSDLSVAAATSRVGFNIGRINGRLLDLELPALEQKQQLDYYRQPPAAGFPRICSQPVSGKAAKFLSGFQRRKRRDLNGERSGCCEMEVTPTVLQKGIRLKLHISQNVPGQVLQQADGEVLAIDKQKLKRR